VKLPTIDNAVAANSERERKRN